jgi:spermidine synthase
MSIWEKILYKGQSKFSGEIKVSEINGVRRLIAEGYTQSQISSNQTKTNLLCWESMVPESLSLGSDSRALILGLGGGVVAKIITERFGNIPIDGVEIDPLIVELGKKYFSLDQPNLNIIVADATGFVKEARYKYDLICIDIFVGSKVPKEIEAKEFLEDAKSLLKKGGVMTMNKIFSSEEEREKFEIFFRGVFNQVESIIVKGGLGQKNVAVHAQK